MIGKTGRYPSATSPPIRPTGVRENWPLRNLERIIQARAVRGGTVKLDLDSVPYALGSMTDPPDSAIGQINPDPQAMTPNFLHGLTGYIIRKQLLGQVIFSSANPHARKQIALLAAQKGCQARKGARPASKTPDHPWGMTTGRKRYHPQQECDETRQDPKPSQAN